MKSMIFTALYIEIITISQPRRACIQTMNRRKSESISLYFGRGIRIECVNEVEAKSLYPFISKCSLSPLFIYHLCCCCLFFVSPQKHIQSYRPEIIIHMSFATVCVFVQLWTRWVWVGNGSSKVQLVSGVGRVRKQPCVRAISGGGWKVGRRLMRKTGSPLGQPSLWTASGILLSYIFGHPGNNGTRLRKGGWCGMGKKIAPRQGAQGNKGMGRYWDEMGGLDFLCNGRIWLVLSEGIGQSAGRAVCECMWVGEEGFEMAPVVNSSLK